MKSARGTAVYDDITSRYCHNVLVEAGHGQKLSSDIVLNGNNLILVDPATDSRVEATLYRPNFQILIDYDAHVRLEPVDEALRVSSTIHFRSDGRFQKEGFVPRSRVYPPSTGSWYERMIAGRDACAFFIQTIAGGSRLWMTVFDEVNQRVVAAHPVKPHEFAAIWMMDDNEAARDAWDHVGPEDVEAARRQILSVLDQPRPSDLSKFWSAIRGAEVVTDISGSTMRDLVDPLVPESLAEAEDIRNEFKAFLAMTILEYRLDTDPVDLINGLLPTSILRGLFGAHLKYRLDGKDTPPYVRVLLDAASHRLQMEDTTRHERLKPHEVAWFHIGLDSPDWTWRALKYCGKSREDTLPLMRLPVGREQAARDVELRKDRAALVFGGYSLRSVVHTQAIGLEQVLFRGNAHTWPHKHLAWAAVLGMLEWTHTERTQETTSSVTDRRPTTLQLLTLPSDALDGLFKIIDESTRQNWRRIEWRTRSFNPECYDSRVNQWTAPLSSSSKSGIPELSLSRLMARLEWKVPSKHESLDWSSTRVLDLTSSHFYLEMLESERFLRDYRIDPIEAEAILRRLLENHVISVQHVVTMSSLPSIAIDLKGDERAVCGLAHAIIQGTPATSAWFSDGGKAALLVTFLAQQHVRPVAVHIVNVAGKLNVKAAVDEVASYSGYLNDMYQRLLRRSDNRWDADISDLISQFSFADSTQATK